MIITRASDSFKPHPALVFHANGTTLRVVRVRKHPTAGCVEDLSQGDVRSALTVLSLPVSRLGPPEYPIAVPTFFGGAFALVDGVEVAATDIDFEPLLGAASPEPTSLDDQPLVAQR